MMEFLSSRIFLIISIFSIIINIFIVIIFTRVFFLNKDIRNFSYDIMKYEGLKILTENSISKKSIQTLITKRINKLDTNNDGTLSEEEFLLEIENLFSSIDSDQDENLQIYELKTNKRKIVNWLFK